MKPARCWIDPLRQPARGRSAHAGRCNFELLRLRGAERTMRELIGRYELPVGFSTAIMRVAGQIERKIVELRASGPVRNT